jgi:CBS domain-containing protein
MSEREKFEASREATAGVAARAGPTAQRYQSALERYLAAVANAHDHQGKTHNALRDELYWNLENNRVSDVMTRPVISVSGDAPFKEIVDTLARHRVSAVPVVDADGKVLGVVSESDLLAKVVAGGDPHTRIRASHSIKVQTRRMVHAETALELMNSPAATIDLDASVVEAARRAASARVRWLPVVDNHGVLVGMVTRSDLLRVFLRSDEELRAHLVDDVLARQFSIDTSAIQLDVHDGVVNLTGQVEQRGLISPLVDAIRATVGVIGVHETLSYRVDDRLALPPRPIY